ncbi:MAG: NAD-binding protein [Eggerthellaceae bacterium]|nr:NAD-binding protein [Eggerthellaceae bacterium]
MAANLRIRISTAGKGGNNEFQIKRKTGIPGENSKGVLDVSELKEKMSRDSRFRLKGETLVIGGGDAAFEAALLAVRCGSEKVTVVCPEQGDEMRASAELISQAEQNGVRTIHGWGPLRIEVHTDGLVSGALFKRCKRAFDDEGRFSPVFDEDNVMGQYCDNLILAID